MESHLYDLASCLGKHVDLEVVVFTRKNRSTVEQCKCFRLHRLSTNAIVAGQPFNFSLPNYLRSLPADIVHVHHPNPYALLAYRASRHPGKLVVTYHSDIVRQKVLGTLIAPVLDKVWERTSAFSVNSEPFVESSPVLRRYRDKVHVVPFGIQPEPYLRPAMKDAAAIRLRHLGVVLFLCVGRLVSYKGFTYAIEAMDLLRKSGIKAHLIIVGDGVLRAQLQQQIERLGLENSISMPGEVEDTLPYYQAADVFMLPSCENNEALGLVQMEAMMCGKPVINTNLPTGVPHVSLHGATGLTVQVKDSQALADAMLRLIQHPDLRCQMGKSARARALSEFTAEKSAELTLAIYERVLAT
jgi:glycosyltransferase involved in cell wall biosynthesis